MNDTTKRVAAVAYDITFDDTADPNNPNNGITLTFADGTTETIQRRDLSDELVNIALWHGVKQKLGDAAAISRDPATGRSATNDDKKTAVMEVFDRLLTGNWNAVRTARASRTATGDLLIALCELYPAKSEADVKEYLAEKTRKEHNALRTIPAVAAKLVEIAARYSDDIDTDGLLDGLMDDDSDE